MTAGGGGGGGGGGRSGGERRKKDLARAEKGSVGEWRWGTMTMMMMIAFI